MSFDDAVDATAPSVSDCVWHAIGVDAAADGGPGCMSTLIAFCLGPDQFVRRRAIVVNGL